MIHNRFENQFTYIRKTYGLRLSVEINGLKFHASAGGNIDHQRSASRKASSHHHTGGHDHAHRRRASKSAEDADFPVPADAEVDEESGGTKVSQRR